MMTHTNTVRKGSLFSNGCEFSARTDSYTIPGNVEHTIEIIEPGEVIDFFTPPREDYL